MNNNNIKTIEKEMDIDSNEFQKEQKKLEIYIQRRSISRPATKVSSALFWILIYLFISFFVAFILNFTFHITTYKWLVYLISHIIFVFLFLKKICIKLIECYQHYAKEETRRKCVCIPSCSEYSIAVLKKYNVFKEKIF